MQYGSLPYPEPLKNSRGDFYDFVTTMFGTSERQPYESGDQSEFIAKHRVFVHERCHWLHHIGTSFGALLSLLQYNRRQFGLRFLRTLPADVRMNVAHSRRTGCRPIVPVAPSDYHLMLPDATEPESLDILRQNVYDGWFAWNAFYDARRCHGLRAYKYPITMISLAIRDAFCGCEDYYGLSGLINGDGDTYLKSNSTNPFAFQDGSSLTTVELMESAAVANELLFLFRANAGAKYICDRLNEAWPTWYGHGLREFMAHTDLSIESFVGMIPYTLASFLIACDIALNPSVPPINIQDGDLGLQWESTYPPHRFLRVIQAGHCPWNVLDIEAMDSHAAIKSLVDELTEAAGLPLYTDQLPLVRDDVDFKPMFSKLFTNGCEESDDELVLRLLGGKHCMYDCISWLHREAWEERRVALHRIVMPGYHLARYSDLHCDGAMAVVLPLNDFRPGLWAPPIIRTGEGNIVRSNGIDPSYATWYTACAFEELLTHQFFFEHGAPAYDMFPTELFPRGVGVMRSVTNMFSKSLGADPW